VDLLASLPVHQSRRSPCHAAVKSAPFGELQCQHLLVLISVLRRVSDVTLVMKDSTGATVDLPVGRRHQNIAAQPVNRPSPPPPSSSVRWNPRPHAGQHTGSPGTSPGARAHRKAAAFSPSVAPWSGRALAQVAEGRVLRADATRHGPARPLMGHARPAGRFHRVKLSRKAGFGPFAMGSIFNPFPFSRIDLN
jgi:hypothetical protein